MKKLIVFMMVFMAVSCATGSHVSDDEIKAERVQLKN